MHSQAVSHSQMKKDSQLYTTQVSTNKTWTPTSSCNYYTVDDLHSPYNWQAWWHFQPLSILAKQQSMSPLQIRYLPCYSGTFTQTSQVETSINLLTIWQANTFFDSSHFILFSRSYHLFLITQGQLLLKGTTVDFHVWRFSHKESKERLSLPMHSPSQSWCPSGKAQTLTLACEGHHWMHAHSSPQLVLWTLPTLWEMHRSCRLALLEPFASCLRRLSTCESFKPPVA